MIKPKSARPTAANDRGPTGFENKLSLVAREKRSGPNKPAAAIE